MELHELLDIDQETVEGAPLEDLEALDQQLGIAARAIRQKMLAITPALEAKRAAAFQDYLDNRGDVPPPQQIGM